MVLCSYIDHSSNPTIFRLAQVVQSQNRGGPAQSSSHLSLPSSLHSYAMSRVTNIGLKVSKVLPCTPLQEAMLASSNDESSTYLNSTIFRVHGDVSRLKVCWQAMFERHEILRTTFISTNDSEFPFLQLVLPSSCAVRPITENIRGQIHYSKLGPFGIITSVQTFEWLVAISERGSIDGTIFVIIQGKSIDDLRSVPSRGLLRHRRSVYRGCVGA